MIIALIAVAMMTFAIGGGVLSNFMLKKSSEIYYIVMLAYLWLGAGALVISFDAFVKPMLK